MAITSRNLFDGPDPSEGRLFQVRHSGEMVFVQLMGAAYLSDLLAVMN